jgi:pilus assembly protein Flp/PilA
MTSDDFHRGNLSSGTAVAFAPAGRVAFAAHTQEEVMFYVVSLLNRIRREDDGQDLLEYALLVALIAIVAVAAVTAAGLKVDEIFKAIVSKLPTPK